MKGITDTCVRTLGVPDEGYYRYMCTYFRRA